MSFTATQLIAYLHQTGVAEWDNAQEYHKGSFCNVSGVLYKSKTNTNVGNDPTSNPDDWKSLLSIRPEDYGAIGDGVTDDFAALVLADAAATAAGATLEGEGTYLISEKWTPTANTIDFRNALIQLDASFPDDEGIILTGYENDKLTAKLNIAGDKSAQIEESGTTDGVAANKLIQSGQNFLTTVSIGMVVKNTNDTTWAKVTNVDSDIQLTLDTDIMVSGDDFEISNGFGRCLAIRDLSSPLTDIHVNIIDSLMGVIVDGNSEKLNVHVGGFEVDVLVRQIINVSTPDENNYWIAGASCKMYYIQDDLTSARVIFNCEGNTGANDFAVKILNAKHVSLGGIIRAMVAGGVEINDPTRDASVTFDSLKIYGTTGNYAVKGLEGRKVTGEINVTNAAAGGVYLGFFSAAVLAISVDGLTGGRGLRLGESGINDFRFGNIKYSGYGNSGSDFGVDLDSVTGHLTLDMSASDHKLRTNNINGATHIYVSTRFILGDVEISINDETPLIDFIGGNTTTAQLAAYSYAAEGMRIDATIDSATFEAPFRPSYFNGGNWSNAEITYTTGSPTLATNGMLALDSSGGAITATLPDGDILYQPILIHMSDASNASTVSVTNHESGDPTILTFNSTADKIVLEWMGTEYRTVYNSGVIIS